jgi:hypothetical protein
MEVGPVIDLVARQVLEPRACGIAEVERQVLDDEQVIGRSPGVARESVVLEPYTGVESPSFTLAALPQLRAAPSVVGALAVPRRLQAPGAAQQHGCSGEVLGRSPEEC